MEKLGKIYISNDGMFTSGANLERVKQNVANKDYKNEKAKQKAMTKAINVFEKSDIDGNGIITLDEIKQYDKKQKTKKVLTIAGIALGAVALGVGAAYLIKSGKLSNLCDKITQKSMSKNLKKNYGSDTVITKGDKGSLFISSNAGPVPEWKVDGKSDFDKFIKRYGLTAVDDTGKEVGKYTMASRGTIEASGDVTMTIPKFKDKFGRTWTMLQEEARPIDVARRGKDARVLAFPAGCIADEAAFLSESATECAVRELAEETGMVAKKIKNLNPFTVRNGERVATPIMTSTGLTDEATYYYEALVDEFKPSTKAITDGGVTRGWHFVPLKNLETWFKTMALEGKIPSGQTLTGLQLMGK